MGEQAPEGQAEFEAKLRYWLTEAARLRNFKRPPSGSAPHVVHESLIQLRAVLDEFEPVLMNVTILKMGAVVQQKELEEAAQDAWDKLADAERTRPVKRDFEGAEERYARWRLASIEQLRDARQARRRAEFAAQVEFSVRTMYWGLMNIREELLGSLRELQWESTMER